MGTHIFIVVVFILSLVPVANFLLLIPILLKFSLKEIPTIILFFMIEIALMIYMLLAPIRDGGIFLQAFLVELVAIIVVYLQASALLKKKNLENDENLKG